MEHTNDQRDGLDTRAVPGTIHLVDLEGVMRGQHASASQLQDVVLVPSPSSDPDDPLNWTPKRKMLSTACMSMYTLMVGIASAAVYSVLEPISEDTGLTVDQLNAGTGYMFLFFGVSYTISYASVHNIKSWGGARTVREAWKNDRIVSSIQSSPFFLSNQNKVTFSGS